MDKKQILSVVSAAITVIRDKIYNDRQAGDMIDSDLEQTANNLCRLYITIRDKGAA